MFNSLSNDFLKQFYSYKRPFQEVRGYYVVQMENGNDVVFVNALGVYPEDIKIEVSPQSYPKTQAISVSGESKNELLGETLSVSLFLYVRKPIKTIYKSFENGLVILEIEYDVPQLPKVNIIER